LLENELFGHERGAFTGADRSERGLVQEANGGTLFLDEIDCLPLAGQVKLLRFLQDKEYRPLGSKKTCKVNVRVVAATNSVLHTAVREGRFRADLYFRLNVIPLRIPPLRERRNDIPLLAQAFVKKYAVEFNKEIGGVSPQVLQALMIHDWPGNVRELEHVVERAVALSQDRTITELDFGQTPESSPTLDSFREAKAKIINSFEIAYIQNLLLEHNGNITLAAQVACKNRRAFWELIRKHRIDVSRFKLNPAAT
jgi:DNA-binding NtrC family response regulator